MIRINVVSEIDHIYMTMEKLSADFFSRNINRKALAEKLSRFGRFLVAYIEDDVAGFAGFYANDTINKTGYLSIIVISKKHRREGVGNRLLRECLDDCRRRGMTKCRLEVNKKNDKAIRFYKSNGFFWEANATEASDYYICNFKEVGP